MRDEPTGGPAQTVSEVLLRQFIAPAPAAIAMFDCEMRYLLVSPRYLADYRLSAASAGPEALLGRSHYDVFPDLPERWRNTHQRVLAGEIRSAEDDPFPRADGRTDRIRWEMTPWRREDGSIGGALLFSEVLTARGNAEIALQAAEARFRALFAAAPVAQLLVDPETRRFISFNATAYGELGYDHDAFTAMRLDDIVAPAAEPAAPSVLLLAPSPNSHVVRFRRHDGEQRDVLLRIAPIELDGRSLLCLAWIDVTEQNATRRERQRLAARQAATLDALPAHVVLLDSSGRIVEANQGWRRAAHENGGARRVEAADVGADYLAACASGAAAGAPQAAKVLEGLQAVLAGQRERLEAIYPCNGPGEPERWFRVVAVPVVPGDPAAGAVVMHTEFTEYVRTRQEIEDREARLISILETVPDAMVVIDEHGIVEAFSAAAERIFGWTAAEMIGRNVAVLMTSPDREQHDAYLARYLATGERHMIGNGRVSMARRKDGSVFPIELSVGEVRDGGARRFTGFGRDLTESRRTQARLRELQEELLHISRLNETGAMASALAHELNQPLTSAISALRAARRTLKSAAPDAMAQTLEALDLAAEQAIRAGRIVQRLRAFVTRGEVEQREEHVVQLIEDASTLALVGTDDQGILVQFDLDPNLPPVFADRVQIQQVLINLIRNAIQAMAQPPPAGGGVARPRTLTLSAKQNEPGSIAVTITDTGPGLAPRVAERLFEPFVTTKPEGMGIGLYISRSIIEAHGGRLWAEPGPAGGTVFRFTLPTTGTDAGHGPARSNP